MCCLLKYFLNEYFQIIWHDWWEVFPPQGWWDDGDQLYSRVMSATRFLQSSSFPCVSVAAAWLIMMSSPPSSPPAVSGETSQDREEMVDTRLLNNRMWRHLSPRVQSNNFNSDIFIVAMSQAGAGDPCWHPSELFPLTWLLWSWSPLPSCPVPPPPCLAVESLTTVGADLVPTQDWVVPVFPTGFYQQTL